MAAAWQGAGMSISDYLIERPAVAMHRDHPDLLYLADARLVARTVAEELRRAAPALQGDDGERRLV
jgi:hypothetical protein